MTEYLNQYSPPDASILYHENDVALRPIRISLPPPPRIDLIDGYGLPAKEQKFKHVEMPHKLRSLERESAKKIQDRAEKDKAYTATIYKIQKEYWDTINNNQEYYRDEIRWIKHQWWHICNGYWFFNNGKPTYITGWHYFYLNFWHIDGQFKPDYRDRDRKEFNFFHYSYTTKESFAKLDKRGYAVQNDDGTYDMVQMKERTCFGVGQNKNRRSGNTNKGLAITYLMTITHRGTSGGVVLSMSGDSASKHMDDKLLPSWRKMPTFLRPFTSSSNSPKAIMHKTPSSVIGEDSLENGIFVAESAQSTSVDGNKYWCMLIDESGKAKNLDVRERHGVAKHCISQGNGSIIFGWEYQPSTAEEMSKGGKAYKELLDDSDFYKRDAISGQTVSGLFRLFVPADEALDGYIDEYGISVRGKKLLKEHKEQGFKATATQFLQGKRDQLLRDAKTNPAAKVEYRMDKKQFPLTYDDSWIGNAGDIGFDVEILDKVLAELSRFPKETRVDFEWTGTRFKSPVKMITNPINGRFYISKILKDDESNQYLKETYWDIEEGIDRDYFTPKYPSKFTCGADPYNFKNTTQANIVEAGRKQSTSKASDGGIAVFWHQDKKIDPDNKPINEWDSNRFVCTYRHRDISDDKFAEDVLKVCIYYGAMCYPETNVPIVWKKFVEWGYGGYLKYDVDEKGKVKERPGVYQLDGSKQEGFNELRNHIGLHGARECHENLITEWKNINGTEEMTRYDLLAASMCALLGAKSNSYTKMIEKESYNYDIKDIVVR